MHAAQQPLLERQRTLLHRFRLLAQLQQIAAARPQLARTHRLDQKIDDAHIERRLAHRLVADHGDQHDRHVAVEQRTPEAARELEPVDDRHAVIEQKKIGTVVVAPAQRGLGIPEIEDLELGTDVLEDVPQHGPCGRLIIDDDDVHALSLPRVPPPARIIAGGADPTQACMGSAGAPVTFL